MNQPLNDRVNETARQYLSHNGGQFRHAGVSLPLDVAVLTIAIQSQIVGSLLTEYGGELGNARALEAQGFAVAINHGQAQLFDFFAE